MHAAVMGAALQAASTGQGPRKCARNIIFGRIREACGNLCRCAASAAVCAWAGNVTFDPALIDSLALWEVSKCPTRDMGTQQHMKSSGWRTQGLACNCRAGPGELCSYLMFMAENTKKKRKCISLITSKMNAAFRDTLAY